MPEIVLFIKDFQLGARVSSVLSQLGYPFKFVEDGIPPIDQVSAISKAIIIDLNESDYATVSLISALKNRNRKMMVFGFMRIVRKKTHDKLKAAGCDIILPRSSLVKNIPSLLKNYRVDEKN